MKGILKQNFTIPFITAFEVLSLKAGFKSILASAVQRSILWSAHTILGRLRAQNRILQLDRVPTETDQNREQVPFSQWRPAAS